MAQIILTVISIALSCFLCIAFIYYGGTAFANAKLKSQSLSLVNVGGQMSMAMILYITNWGQGDMSSYWSEGKVSSPLIDGGGGDAGWAYAITTDNGLTYANVYAPISLHGDLLDNLCMYFAIQSGYQTPYYTPIYGNLLPHGIMFGCIGNSAGANFNYLVQINAH